MKHLVAGSVGAKLDDVGVHAELAQYVVQLRRDGIDDHHAGDRLIIDEMFEEGIDVAVPGTPETFFHKAFPVGVCQDLIEKELLDSTPARLVGDGKLEELLPDVTKRVVGREFVLDDVEAGVGGKGEVEEVTVWDRNDAILAHALLHVEVEGVLAENPPGVLDDLTFEIGFFGVLERDENVIIEENAVAIHGSTGLLKYLVSHEYGHDEAGVL